MDHYDRLTTLMARFEMRVCMAPISKADLVVLANRDGQPGFVCFGAPGGMRDADSAQVLFSAAVDWGGAANPLLAALPDQIMLDVSGDLEMAALTSLMHAEVQAQRCGAASVLNRLGEVLIVRILRAQIEAGTTRAGLLAGLSDPRISRSIVVIHDQPGRDWRMDDLAQIAGLSRSRFAEVFLGVVGETPAAYLRRWRLTLARQDILRGDRIDAIARRYGYGAPEGFARAFKTFFGETPIALRPKSPA
jgi:AraC-like DNA-binding protein